MTPSPIRRLFRYAQPHHSAIRRASLWSVLNKIFDLAPPALIGAAVDIVVERQNSLIARLGVVDVSHQLVALAAITVLIWALESVLEYAQKLGWRNLAQTMQHELRVDAYSHTQGLDLSYFEDRSTGGLMAVLNDDINQLERFLDGGANDLLQVSTTVIVIGGTFFWIEPTIAFLSFLPVPLVVWGSFAFQKRIAPRYMDVRERVGVLNASLENNLAGIATIKSFTTEPREVERIRVESQDYRESNRRAIRLSSAFSPIIRMAIVVGFTATLIYGGLAALRGDLAVGAYSVLVFLTQRLLWPLTRLGDTFDLYQRAMASTTRVLDLLDARSRVNDGSICWETPPSGVIRFEDVGFSYANGNEVLFDLNFKIDAGQRVAFVGSTNAGKTSIIKILLRFYDPTHGCVTIDGIDVRNLRKDELRCHIGLVSQDVYLFPGTVADNIAYGSRSGATVHEEIEEAARTAEAHTFITELRDGYETTVGERGQKLSGGQKQRISIARAVIKDPPILILDEATSAVDNETEAAIQRSMDRMANGRTMILIAHRLSTVRHADVIFVLDKGRIIEEGNHRELLKQEGLYARLWAVQTGEAGEVASDTATA